MPFVNNILQYNSLSIVGLEKNTGKTVCLNYILQRLNQMGISCAVTSIGVDGEQCDAVYGTAKPEITLYQGMHFITSEQHYLQRRLISQITHIEEERTSLGRLVTAQVLCPGKVLLSGAATTAKLSQQISQFHQLTIVDGALSRLSLASPTVTDAMVLATGAAVSPNLQQLLSKTRFVCRLIRLPEVDSSTQQLLSNISQGIWSIDSEGVLHNLQIPSVFLLKNQSHNLFRYGTRLFVSGAVSDLLLKYLIAQPHIAKTTLIVRDFTKLFITPELFAEYTKRGGTLQVLQQSNLIAICLNPTSPQGYRINSAEACSLLSQNLDIPVYDVMMCQP